jgi:hypothetical protein
MKIRSFVIAGGIALAVAAFPAAVQNQGPTTAEQIHALMARVNAQLENAGADYRLEVAEYLTAADEAGQTVFFNNRGNKQLAHHFVPADPRRGGGTNITYIVDQAEGATNDGLTVAQTTAAIDRSMATWDNVQCSTIPITRLAPVPGDLGVVEFQNGLGGSPVVLADLTHAGWLPPGILANNVIAATFTFIFINPDNSPTDIDNNGKADTAFREILYNDFHAWAINGNIDVETVSLHEVGHGLSQNHFGKAFRTEANGKLHFSPRAVMNAAYSGVQQAIGKTDNAGHCSIWGSWPNN